MHWVALQWQPERPEPEPEPASQEGAAPAAPEPAPLPLSREALGWWALQFTPRVAWVDEALLLEISSCERLWGGRLGLMREVAARDPVEGWRLGQAQGATALVALARSRLFSRGEAPPAELPAALPLDTLSAARPHLEVLARMGCRTWGQVAALPRGGLARRFGAGLREALDCAWGLRPEQYPWLVPPDSFEQKLELPALVENAQGLLWAAQRLLSALQLWLRARQRGVLALELQWTLDLRRFNGVNLPPHQQVVVRTAQPTQDMAHLRRLIAERLALTTLAAPASWLRLRSVETTPWGGASTSFLPDEHRPGDRLHELVERLSARLGPAQVLRARARDDHRPEQRQHWVPAVREAAAGRRPPPAPSAGDLYPPWLLREPLRLAMDGERPCYEGTLRQLVGPQRVEAGWWTEAPAAGAGPADGPGPARLAVRDYYIAESPGAGLVWIFRERPSARFSDAPARWYLQGLYA